VLHFIKLLANSNVKKEIASDVQICYPIKTGAVASLTKPDCQLILTQAWGTSGCKAIMSGTLVIKIVVMGPLSVAYVCWSLSLQLNAWEFSTKCPWDTPQR